MRYILYMVCLAGIAFAIVVGGFMIMGVVSLVKEIW